MEFKWECFRDTQYDERMYRAKVFGGWLVRMSERHGDNNTDSLTFVPDHKHQWSVD